MLNKKVGLFLVLGVIATTLTICFGKYVMSWNYFPMFFSGNISEGALNMLIFETMIFELLLFSALVFFWKALEMKDLLVVDLGWTDVPIMVQIIISAVISFILYLDGISFMLSFIIIFPITFLFWVLIRILNENL